MPSFPGLPGCLLLNFDFLLQQLVGNLLICSVPFELQQLPCSLSLFIRPPCSDPTSNELVREASPRVPGCLPILIRPLGLRATLSLLFCFGNTRVGMNSNVGLHGHRSSYTSNRASAVYEINTPSTVLSLLVLDGTPYAIACVLA